MGNDTTTDPWAGMTAGGGGNGSYWKWTEVGQTVIGTITTKRAGTDTNGFPCPEIDVTTDDGEVLTVTASQYELKSKILEANPQVGDRIAIAFTGEEPVTKGKMKNFDVAVKAGDGTAPAPAPAAAAKPDASALL